MPLCGHNATLTSPGLVFNTTEPLFSVVLQWTQPAATLRSGGFILKFAAFYNGKTLAFSLSTHAAHSVITEDLSTQLYKAFSLVDRVILVNQICRHNCM